MQDCENPRNYVKTHNFQTNSFTNENPLLTSITVIGKAPDVESRYRL